MSRDFFDSYLSVDNPAVRLGYDAMLYVHDWTGLPWWASVALTTVALRSIITLPLVVYGRVNQARLRRLQPEFERLAAELRDEVRRAAALYSWDGKTARRHYNATMRKLRREAFIRENCHPAKGILVVFTQIPLWIALSLALRNLCGAYFGAGFDVSHLIAPGMQNEGALWFPDLTLRDTTWALPVGLGLSNLAIVEIQQPGSGGWLKNLFRLLSLLMIPLSAVMPSAMSWYWLCSSLFGLVQNIAFKYIDRRSKGTSA